MKKALTGAQAAAEAMRQINPDVAPVYPITPQTPIMESFASFVADGKVETELIRVESEHSAMSAAVGASAAGARVMTATSSQGLALMMEILPIASGLRLPIVMNVVNRALSAPINIHCDHSDSMACRDFAWIQIYSENNQEVYDNTVLAQKIAEKAGLPVMVMQDGFITSHCVEEVEILEDEKVKKFVGEYKPEISLLKNKITYGAIQMPDYNFETKRQESDAIEKSKKIFIDAGKELSKITGRKYYYFEGYRLKDASCVIITMNSAAGTVKAVVDSSRKKGKKVGLLKPVLFRPFPYEEIGKILKNKKIAVLDRSESFGANPPLFAEIKNAVPGSRIQSCVFGLGGRDLHSKDIEKVFDDLMKNKFDSKIKYIGLRE
jgi:pyruvate ferredoxin oxidoreductase alpha subunit